MVFLPTYYGYTHKWCYLFANKSQKFDIRIIVRQLATEVPKESLQGFFR